MLPFQNNKHTSLSESTCNNFIETPKNVETQRAGQRAIGGCLIYLFMLIPGGCLLFLSCINEAFIKYFNKV